MNRRQVRIIVLILLLLTLSPVAHAHRMLLDRDGDTMTVYYDDGTVSARSEIRLFDEEDNLLWEGPVGDDGTVRLTVGQFHKAVAEDGLGHRAVYISGAAAQNEIPRPLAATLGVSFFVFVAAVSNFLGKRKQDNPAGNE